MLRLPPPHGLLRLARAAGLLARRHAALRRRTRAARRRLRQRAGSPSTSPTTPASTARPTRSRPPRRKGRNVAARRRRRAAAVRRRAFDGVGAQGPARARRRPGRGRARGRAACCAPAGACSPPRPTPSAGCGTTTRTAARSRARRSGCCSPTRASTVERVGYESVMPGTSIVAARTPRATAARAPLRARRVAAGRAAQRVGDRAAIGRRPRFCRRRGRCGVRRREQRRGLYGGGVCSRLRERALVQPEPVSAAHAQ